jgi:hypothetical protein
MATTTLSRRISPKRVAVAIATAGLALGSQPTALEGTGLRPISRPFEGQVPATGADAWVPAIFVRPIGQEGFGDRLLLSRARSDPPYPRYKLPGQAA